MPTGYTADIEKGITLRQFILSCARSMGACIMQRDDPSSDLPKKREPSDYHFNCITEAQARLEELICMTNDIANKKAKDEYNQERKLIKSIIRKNNDLKVKYKKMLVQVNSWNPPTPEHHGLKNFMISQIEESIKFDCDGSYYHDRERDLKLLPGQEWKDIKIKEVLCELRYHKTEHAKEIEECRKQNEWIDQLYNSLPK